MGRGREQIIIGLGGALTCVGALGTYGLASKFLSDGNPAFAAVTILFAVVSSKTAYETLYKPLKEYRSLATSEYKTSPA